MPSCWLLGHRGGWFIAGGKCSSCGQPSPLSKGVHSMEGSRLVVQELRAENLLNLRPGDVVHDESGWPWIVTGFRGNTEGQALWFIETTSNMQFLTKERGYLDLIHRLSINRDGGRPHSYNATMFYTLLRKFPDIRRYLKEEVLTADVLEALAEVPLPATPSHQPSVEGP